MGERGKEMRGGFFVVKPVSKEQERMVAESSRRALTDLEKKSRRDQQPSGQQRPGNG